MSGSEFGIIVVGALVGWWVVSWIIERLRPKPPPAAASAAPAAQPSAPVAPPALPAGPAAAAPAPAGAPSLAELGERWWQILGVERAAPVAAIEAAYHARLAALDAVRFAAAASEADRARALAERGAVEAAYEFIRAAGSWGSRPP